jgi:hypothetical protein
MALDGIMYDGVGVRVRRPNDYNAAAGEFDRCAVCDLLRLVACAGMGVSVCLECVSF